MFVIPCNWRYVSQTNNNMQELLGLIQSIFTFGSFLKKVNAELKAENLSLKEQKAILEEKLAIALSDDESDEEQINDLKEQLEVAGDLQALKVELQKLSDSLNPELPPVSTDSTGRTLDNGEILGLRR